MFSEEVDYLKALILDLEIIKSNQKLKSGKWNKSSYEILSNLMFTKLDNVFSDKEKMSFGISLSSRTLYNLFEGKRIIRRPFDKRVIRTLDKLARFVDLKNWDKVVVEKESQSNEKGAQNSDKKIVIQFLKKVKDEEFELYRTLNKTELKKLKTKYVKGSAAEKEIIHNFKEFCKTGLTLSNSYNPSSFSIIDVKVKRNKNYEGAYVLTTNEFWTLCWFDPESKRYTSRVKKVSKHIYTVLKDEVSDELKIQTEATEALKV